MRAPLLAGLALTLALGACAGVRESRLNPLNWFGRSEARASTVVRGTGLERPADPRPLVDQVTAMTVEAIPGGAILRATGLPPTQGFWLAELVRVDTILETTGADGTVTRVRDTGVLVFDFRLAPPPYQALPGTPVSREIEVATYLTVNDLAGVSRIVVRGLRTERVIRR